jgi:hypothetical protein
MNVGDHSSVVTCLHTVNWIYARQPNARWVPNSFSTWPRYEQVIQSPIWPLCVNKIRVATTPRVPVTLTSYFPQIRKDQTFNGWFTTTRQRPNFV